MSRCVRDFREPGEEDGVPPSWHTDLRSDLINQNWLFDTLWILFSCQENNWTDKSGAGRRCSISRAFLWSASSSRHRAYPRGTFREEDGWMDAGKSGKETYEWVKNIYYNNIRLLCRTLFGAGFTSRSDWWVTSYRVFFLTGPPLKMSLDWPPINLLGLAPPKFSKCLNHIHFARHLDVFQS